jgi:hypothetical protein
MKCYNEQDNIGIETTEQQSAKFGVEKVKLHIAMAAIIYKKSTTSSKSKK